MPDDQNYPTGLPRQTTFNIGGVPVEVTVSNASSDEVRISLGELNAETELLKLLGEIAARQTGGADASLVRSAVGICSHVTNRMLRWALPATASSGGGAEAAAPPSDP